MLAGPVLAAAGGAGAAGGAEAAGAGAGAGEAVSGAYGATAGELGAAGLGSSGVAGAGGYMPGGESVSGNYGATTGELGRAAASYGGGAAGGTGLGTTAGGSALSRIFDGTGGTADYLSVLGSLGQAAYGAYASDKQADLYKEQSDKYMAMGAPYRDKLSQLYSNPNSYLQSPEVQGAVQQGSDSLARTLSIHGNPAGSGSALHELQNYATNQQLNRLGAEKDRLAGFGGLASFNAAAPAAGNQAIAQNANTYNAIGAGLGGIFNPPQKQMTLAEMLKGSGQYY